MNPEDLLQQLAPLRAPEAVGWWPLAIGWWVLIALTLILLIAGVVLLLRRRASNRYRRLALQEVDTLLAKEASVAELNQLLKAVAIRVYGQAPASLSGRAWLTYMHTVCTSVSEQQLAPLEEIYGPNREIINADLAETARRWIAQHRVTPHV